MFASKAVFYQQASLLVQQHGQVDCTTCSTKYITFKECGLFFSQIIIRKEHMKIHKLQIDPWFHLRLYILSEGMNQEDL